MGDPTSNTNRRRRRLRRLAAAAALLPGIVVVVSAGLLLWWTRPVPIPPLAPGWLAMVAAVAGDGTVGVVDGDARHARFADPFGIAVAADGTVYVADGAGSHRIRRLRAGRVDTVAGSERGFADGPGRDARFDTPSGIAVDAQGTLYIADTANNRIRRLTPDGRVSTLAGSGIAGYADGAAADAQFNGPIGVALDLSGRVIVADSYNDCIRVITPDGTVSTLAGQPTPGFLDGTGAVAAFDTPTGLAVDRSGNVLVADTGNGRLRSVDPAGTVTTPVNAPPLFRPVGIGTTPDGDIYIADERGWIVEIAADGSSRTLAGTTQGFRDGPGRDAQFRSPAALAVVHAGRLLVADRGNALVRQITAAAHLPVAAPPPPLIAPGFDARAFAMRPLLWPIAPMEGPHEVAGTMGEARGSEGAERLHVGLDIRDDQGTPVRAVRDGVVTNPIAIDGFGSLNESLRIGPLAYIHIRAGRDEHDASVDVERFVPTYRDGRLAGIRAKRGARFETGDVVGTINAFYHVHLNVGWPGEEYNALTLGLVQFEDTIPPTIAAGGVRLFDEHWQPLTVRERRRVVVAGRVQIVVDAWDQAEGNTPSRRLGLFDLGYQILKADGTPAAGFEKVRHTLRFDRLSPAADIARTVYAPGSGIPFYRRGRTRFLYIVTSRLRDGIAEPGFWDASALPPGDYIVRAWAADVRGNAAIANRDLPITIVALPAAP